MSTQYIMNVNQVFDVELSDPVGLLLDWMIEASSAAAFN